MTLASKISLARTIIQNQAIEAAAKAAFLHEHERFGMPHDDWEAAPDHVRAGHLRDARLYVTAAFDTIWPAATESDSESADD